MTALTLWLMTIATGLCVGNIYFNQPLLEAIRLDFGLPLREIGLVPTLTQVGYAGGMLFLVPLGDMFDRRHLIAIATAISGVTLLSVACAPTYAALLVATTLLGITTMTPQFIIPFAAHIAPPDKRGQVLGTIMSGLLLGCLLARTIAGFVGGTWGWRLMFGATGAVEVVFAMVLYALLPNSEPTYKGHYFDLLKSVVSIVKTQPVVREAALIGAMIFGAFSAFWATLVFLMATFGRGPEATGLFGLLGAGGALAAPLVGRLTDRRAPRQTVGLGLVLAILSFFVFLLSTHSIVGLCIGVFVMDVGVQTGHVSNQGRIFALLPEARSRINTAYMFSYFTGAALGSWLGAKAWALAGWPGVCCVGLGMLCIAGIVFMRGRQSEQANKTKTQKDDRNAGEDKDA